MTVAITREERERKRQDALDYRRPEDNWCVQCGGTWGAEDHTAEECIAIDELRWLDALDAADALAETLDRLPVNWLYEMEPGYCREAAAALAAYRKIVALASAERSGAAS